jgi:integrase
MYCTEIRIGEALNLKMDEINLENGVITISSGKRNVSRLLPIKESHSKWLINYKTLYYKVNSIYFFQSPIK